VVQVRDMKQEVEMTESGPPETATTTRSPGERRE
jgi:hypothetical protein